MNPSDFLAKWQLEKSMYSAWGEFVVSKITAKIESSGHELNAFLKQSCAPRTKNDQSLVDKAFHRGKAYDDPYQKITDKVGCRFVVLVSEHIREIEDIINANDSWNSSKDRDYKKERAAHPEIFDYQSVHYVICAKTDIESNGILIKKDTPCEIQIRTMLQHTYAELSHDAIYKSNAIVDTNVKRAVAKSMALIEITDDLFSKAYEALNKNTIKDLNLQTQLDSLYQKLMGGKPDPAQKSTTIILDAFQSVIDESLILTIEKFFQRKPDYVKILLDNKNRNTHQFFSQSIILFLCWLIVTKKTIAKNEWPIDLNVHQMLATNFGVSFNS